MTRKVLLLWVFVPLLLACARHVVVERDLVQSLNDASWRVESEPEASTEVGSGPLLDSQSGTDLEERLRRLERLREEGLISEEEYEQKRADLMGQL